MGDWGLFPFGMLNAVLPARAVERPEAVVIGTYPNAWHVEWRAPPQLRGDGRRGVVASLPVDIEPSFFLTNPAREFAPRLAHWKKMVGFIDGKHGTLSSKSPSLNASSSGKILSSYLTPLGLKLARTTFTAVIPVYCPKLGRAGRRDAGDEIEDEYNGIAQGMEAPLSDLPIRPAGTKVAALAAARFGDKLVGELSSAGAPLVITFGEEVWQTLLAIPSLHARPPRRFFSDLYGDAYGEKGSLVINGESVAWLPLIHPGLLKGALDPAAPVTKPRTADGWATLHLRWVQKRMKARVDAGEIEPEPVRAPKPPKVPKTKPPPKPPRVPGPPHVRRPAPPPVAPEGSDQRLTIVRARFRTLRKLGPTLEVVFEVPDGPHRGARARGRFPIAGRGLIVLVAVALFEPLKNYATVAARLVGAQLVADLIHGGTMGHSLALVRNLRPVRQAAKPAAPEAPALAL